jgi:hypothetical protein
MPKIVAWLIVIVAATLIYSLAFTPFSHMVGYESSGSGGYVPKYVECPAPVSVLFFDAKPEDDSGTDACVPPARTLALEAGIVALVAGVLAWKPLRRSRPEPIERISARINPSNDPRRG